MPKGCFVACCGSLRNPENAHAIDKFRVVLVESTGDFRVYALGKRFERQVPMMVALIVLGAHHRNQLVHHANGRNRRRLRHREACAHCAAHR